MRSILSYIVILGVLFPIAATSQTLTAAQRGELQDRITFLCSDAGVETIDVFKYEATGQLNGIVRVVGGSLEGNISEVEYKRFTSITDDVRGNPVLCRFEAFEFWLPTFESKNSESGANNSHIGASTASVRADGDIKIDFKNIQIEDGKISLFFGVTNVGFTEVRRDLFGGGSFGNGGSTMVVGGKEYTATGIEFAGKYAKGIVAAKLIPKITYDARIDFDGMYATASDLKAFKLAMSINNFRPSMVALFHLRL